jgi:predicted Ser/Thr protein kinase
MKCPSCSKEVTAESRFCPGCGTPVLSVSQIPTGMADSPPVLAPDAGTPMMASPVGRLISSDSIPVGGFTPGMVLAERYRIIGLLGRGGMGEVYRADDLKLGQPVALKFLPKALADDPVRRERFYAEVRIARQVSHPNICRVYDIGELDGRHFLTMEYIDGEDLASLLKRIGNLHGTKALDIARQLCAGLAAAHDKGVLHRDLKPANVMIDGRGRVRITDFGLAVAAGEEIPSGDASGTPAYMAPEQFAGKGSSIRSDIYALGLVLYELYTGRKAFSAPTMAELRAAKESATPTAPSEIAREIDPVVERVILRCMEKDPRQRPASVAQVAAALPGGDPLAAAIAAGETPSPEMVAASGSKEGLKPWVAWTCLAFVIVGICAAAFLGRQALLFRRVPIENPPEAMAVSAREILKKAGYPQPPVDGDFGFSVDDEYFQYMRKNDRSAGRWDRMPSSVIGFWYRQSPRPLVHWYVPINLGFGISPQYMPLSISGESLVQLDARGRLTSFYVIPPERDESTEQLRIPVWTTLFEAAEIDPAKWTPVAPSWTPLLYADTRVAWTGALPDRPEVPMRIEAAAYRGKPVFWKLIAPWNNPSRMAPSSPSPGQKAAILLMITFPIALMLCGAFFARRNLRLGRGDRRGAERLAYLVFTLVAVAWIVGEHHVPDLAEFYLFLQCLSWALLLTGFPWLLYIALEPFVRRRWPSSLVSWNRLFAGGFRDPLVGRDLLVSCVVGVVLVLLDFLGHNVAHWVGVRQDVPIDATINMTLDFFAGTRAALAMALLLPVWSLFWGIGTLFLLCLLRVLLRRKWLAAMLFVLILTTFFGLSSDSPLTMICYALEWGTAYFILVRFGLLASTVQYTVMFVLEFFPVTPQLSAWYSGIGIAGVVLILGFAAYAFRTSLGGRPMFQAKLLED